MADHIAGAQKVKLPDTAHMLNMEQPDKFNGIVLAFLAGAIQTASRSQPRRLPQHAAGLLHHPHWIKPDPQHDRELLCHLFLRQPDHLDPLAVLFEIGVRLRLPHGLRIRQLLHP